MSSVNSRIAQISHVQNSNYDFLKGTADYGSFYLVGFIKEPSIGLQYMSHKEEGRADSVIDQLYLKISTEAECFTKLLIRANNFSVVANLPTTI